MLQNAAGNYVAPGGEGGPLALAGAEFNGDDMRAWVTTEAAQAYPITTFTWTLEVQAGCRRQPAAPSSPGARGRRTFGTYSAVAGGVALAVLMLPTVILTADELMRTVPTRMKEAAVGIGCTPTQVVAKVVLPTALPGILTGIILGIARVAGELAPLLFTALFSNFWLSSLFEPTASLSILIYNFSSMPFPNQIELAWAASLVLVLIVLFFNILSRLVGRPKV